MIIIDYIPKFARGSGDKRSIKESFNYPLFKKIHWQVVMLQCDLFWREIFQGAHIDLKEYHKMLRSVTCFSCVYTSSKKTLSIAVLDLEVFIYFKI